MKISADIVYGRILMARLPLTSTISAELNLGIRIKKLSFFWPLIVRFECHLTSSKVLPALLGRIVNTVLTWEVDNANALDFLFCSQYSDFSVYFVVEGLIFLWSQLIHFWIFWNYVAKMASGNTSLSKIKFPCMYRLQKSLQNKCWCE